MTLNPQIVPERQIYLNFIYLKLFIEELFHIKCLNAATSCSRYSGEVAYTFHLRSLQWKKLLGLKLGDLAGLSLALRLLIHRG